MIGKSIIISLWFPYIGNYPNKKAGRACSPTDLFSDTNLVFTKLDFAKIRNLNKQGMQF